MITIGKSTPDTAEAMKLSRKIAGLQVLCYCREFAQEWGHKYPDPTYNYYCMLSAIFAAGYMQGKREERRRIAERNEKQAERIRTDAKEQYRQSAKIYLDATGSTEALKLQSELVFNVWKLWKNKGKFQDETT